VLICCVCKRESKCIRAREREREREKEIAKEQERERERERERKYMQQSTATHCKPCHPLQSSKVIAVDYI